MGLQNLIFSQRYIESIALHHYQTYKKTSNKKSLQLAFEKTTPLIGYLLGNKKALLYQKDDMYAYATSRLWIALKEKKLPSIEKQFTLCVFKVIRNAIKLAEAQNSPSISLDMCESDKFPSYCDTNFALVEDKITTEELPEIVCKKGIEKIRFSGVLHDAVEFLIRRIAYNSIISTNLLKKRYGLNSWNQIRFLIDYATLLVRWSYRELQENNEICKGKFNFSPRLWKNYCRKEPITL